MRKAWYALAVISCLAGGFVAVTIYLAAWSTNNNGEFGTDETGPNASIFILCAIWFVVGAAPVAAIGGLVLAILGRVLSALAPRPARK